MCVLEHVVVVLSQELKPVSIVLSLSQACYSVWTYFVTTWRYDVWLLNINVHVWTFMEIFSNYVFVSLFCLSVFPVFGNIFYHVVSCFSVYIWNSSLFATLSLYLLSLANTLKPCIRTVNIKGWQCCKTGLQNRMLFQIT